MQDGRVQVQLRLERGGGGWWGMWWLYHLWFSRGSGPTVPPIPLEPRTIDLIIPAFLTRHDSTYCTCWSGFSLYGLWYKSCEDIGALWLSGRLLDLRSKSRLLKVPGATVVRYWVWIFILCLVHRNRRMKIFSILLKKCWLERKASTQTNFKRNLCKTHL